ncbi:prostasin-like [Oppia nitens]|uniref:prostasin-like n=1 Tax=Oppia nitens TaxID=1686743 RepID=UPI0023DB8751|nr:prostasin-like [Oppia nitens]
MCCAKSILSICYIFIVYLALNHLVVIPNLASSSPSSLSDINNVHGQPASISKYPWTVSIEFENQILAGGTIVGKQHVLTNARVFHDLPKKKNFYVVHMGTDQFYNHSLEEVGAMITIDEFKLHPDYNPETGANDLAIVKLAKPVPVNRHTIALAQLPNGKDGQVGDRAVANGLYLPDPQRSDINFVLASLPMTIIDQQTCRTKTKDDNPYKLTEQMLCAVPQNARKGLCEHDIGFPLTTSTGHLIGLNSWYRTCDHTVGKPAVFTRIANYTDWIKQNLN